MTNEIKSILKSNTKKNKKKKNITFNENVEYKIIPNRDQLKQLAKENYTQPNNNSTINYDFYLLLLIALIIIFFLFNIINSNCKNNHIKKIEDIKDNNI